MSTEELPQYAQLLRRYIARAGYPSNAELARRAHLSLHGITPILKGIRKRPHHKSLDTLADTLNLSPEERQALHDAAEGEDAASALDLQFPRRSQQELQHQQASLSTMANQATHERPALPQPDTLESPAPQRFRDMLPFGGVHQFHELAELSPLIGREQDIQKILHTRKLLSSEQRRLLTLVGGPGVGKTRLAKYLGELVCSDFPGGVYFVSLADLKDTRKVFPEIAIQLGLKALGDVSLEQLLLEYLARREEPLLLILDNFEHVAEAAEALAELLYLCPRVRILVTSRCKLNVRGERRYTLEPLTTPPDLQNVTAADINTYAATRLFAMRIQAQHPDFALTDENAKLIATICARLDGIPLAIKLATPWYDAMTLEELLHHLESQLDLLVGGECNLAPRHRTMRGAIATSYNLLEPSLQRLFRRLSVFVGGATLEAVEQICAEINGIEPLGAKPLHGLLALSNHHLIIVDKVAGQSRYRMTQVIREYAQEQFQESGEGDAIRQVYARYYLKLTEQAPRFFGSTSAQLAMFTRLNIEHDNLHVALSWAAERQDLRLGLALIERLAMYWQLFGWNGEGRQWIERFLALVSDPRQALADPELKLNYAWARLIACDFALAQNDFAAASALVEDNLALAQQLGAPSILVTALIHTALVVEYQDACDYHSETHLPHRADASPNAITIFEQALQLARDEDEQRSYPYALNVLAQHLNLSGRPSEASLRAQESLKLAQRLDRPLSEVRARLVIANIAIKQNDLSALNRLRTVRLHSKKALELCKTPGFTAYTAWALEARAWLIATEGRREPEACRRATRLLAAACSLRARIGLDREVGAAPQVRELSALARVTLGDDIWNNEMSAGKALNEQDAIAEGLLEWIKPAQDSELWLQAIKGSDDFGLDDLHN